MRPENFPVNSNPRFTENLKRGFFYKELSCDDIFSARRCGNNATAYQTKSTNPPRDFFAEQFWIDMQGSLE
jgi:hypothetical protein